MLWILFIIIATFCAWKEAGGGGEWSFIEGLYFAVSSLSTGGHYSLPDNTPEWQYGLTGFYAALGVPIMGVAMATIASFFIHTGDIDETIAQIRGKLLFHHCTMYGHSARFSILFIP